MDLASVVNGNNTAIAKLQGGHCREALSLLQSAMFDLRDQINTPQNSNQVNKKCIVLDSSETHPMRSLSTTTTTNNVAVSSLPLQHVPLFEKRKAGGSVIVFDESILAIFDRAFLVGDSGIDKNLLVAVILYNMALTYHTHSGNSAVVRRALNLYKISLNYLERVMLPNPEVGLLIMALYNNIAQIQTHNCSLQESELSMKKLAQLLETLMPSNPLEQEEYSLFYLNAVVFLGKRTHRIAPAA